MKTIELSDVFKSVIFTLFVPGTVVGVIPTLLYFFLQLTIILAGFRFIGILFLVTGGLFYLFSVFSFLKQGKGTPMIFFMEKTHKIFGKEPIKLVNSILYKFSRNPIYLGVIIFIFGLGLFLESGSILTWSIIALVIFHLVIVKLEEPHLREKYGAIYREYCKETPRWIGMRRFTY